ncbi:PAS domain S-box protein [bacterium]|nr:PAS domain S-box protein [bacterium]
MSVFGGQKDSGNDLYLAERIVDTVREPFMVLDDKLRIVMANRSFYRTFRLTPENTEGRLIYEVGGGQWDIPRLRKVLDQYISQYTVFNDFEFEYEFGNHGRRTMIINSHHVCRNTDRHHFNLLTIQDITENRQMEDALGDSDEKYQRLMENIPGMVYLFTIHPDKTYSFPFVSSASRELFGIEPEDLMRDSSLLAAIIHPDDREKLDESIIKSAETLQPWKEELRVIVNGEVRWYTCVSRPELQSDGSILWDGIILEITDRVKIEQALRESESKYRRLHETMMDAFVSIDMTGRIQEANHAFQTLIGYTEKELNQLTYRDLTPEKWHSFEEGIIEEQILAHGYSTVYEKEYRRKDGTIFPVELRTFLMRDDRGEPVVMWAIARDITERKKTEAQLEHNLRETRMRLEINQALMGKNTENEVLDVLIQNAGIYPQTFVSIMMFTTEGGELTAIARRADSFESGIIPQVSAGSKFPVSRFPMLGMFSGNQLFITNDILTDDNIDSFSREFIRAAGGASRAVLPLAVDNEWMGYILIVSKIKGYFDEEKILLYQTLAKQGAIALHAARLQEIIRESQQRLSLLVEQSPLAFIEWNPDDNVVSWNPAAERIFGFSSEEARALHSWRDIMPEASWPEFEKIWHDLTAQKGAAHIIVDNLTKNGKLITCEWFNAPLVGPDNDFIGIVSLVQDITEHKLAEEEKAKLESQLLQAQKMESVGRLAGGVAHDFNNMLNVVLGYAELIKTRLHNDDPLLNDVVEIEKAASHARDITRQLLAFSRKQIISPRPMDLNDLITSTQKTLARLIGEDIDLRFHPDKDLWKIRFDPTQIEQILINLAVNARDAMPNGGMITIETANVLIENTLSHEQSEFPPGYYVMLSLSDNGAGMRKETLSHVFEPFFTTKEVGKGTGLGLATVYGIVKQNGGFINVYSEPGQGTTFKIHIPGINEEKTTENNEEMPVSSRSGTILLVEDDPMVRRVAQMMLERFGYTVLVADSPLGALSLCEKSDTPIDLLITDVVMPEVNGSELKNRIVAIKPGIKVLFMSGYTGDIIVHHGMLEEGVHFIQKPFSMNELARKISEVLGEE